MSWIEDNILSIIIVTVAIIIVIVTLTTNQSNFGKGGGGGWHGGGRGGWHGGGRHFGGVGRHLGRGYGWGWPWYTDYTVVDNVYQSPSSQKIGFAVSDDGVIVDIMFDGYSDGDMLYSFMKNGINISSEKRKLPLKNGDKIPLTIDGNAKIFTINIGK